MLDFSKIEAGRLELEETAFSLSGLIDGVISTLRRQAAVKGLALGVEIAEGSERHAGRRFHARAADPVQPRRQRAEVHRPRPRAGARLDRRRSAAAAPG